MIFSQGDEGTSLFIIEDGAVDICYGEGAGNVTLATLFNGQYFGELSLFDGAPRSATATASKPTRVIRLDREDLVDFVHKNPAAALRIIEEMGDRLRQTNELMSRQVSRNVLQEQEERLTFGQRIADRVASFGGSWPFIILFSVFMTVWMSINVLRVTNFDPYPFILLNLALSSRRRASGPDHHDESEPPVDEGQAPRRERLPGQPESGDGNRGAAARPVGVLARLAVVERLISRRAGLVAVKDASGE